jgi:hypothetical protein
MTQPYPFTYTADTQHAKASAATRLRSSRLAGSFTTSVTINALVVIDEWLADYQRAGERGTVEAQLDIIWPTTGTRNRTEAPEDRCFRLIDSQSAREGHLQLRFEHGGKVGSG